MSDESVLKGELTDTMKRKRSREDREKDKRTASENDYKKLEKTGNSRMIDNDKRIYF